MKSAILPAVGSAMARSRPAFSRFVLVFALTLTTMFAAVQMTYAQGVFGGMDQGARRGNRAAGPVGAVVGGAVGGAVGGVNGVLGIQPRYYRHHRHHHHRRYR